MCDADLARLLRGNGYNGLGPLRFYFGFGC